MQAYLLLEILSSSLLAETGGKCPLVYSVNCVPPTKLHTKSKRCYWSKNIINQNQILQDCRDRLRSSARLMIFRGNQQKTKRVTVAIKRRILLICRLFFSKRLEKNYMGQLKFLWTQKGQTNIRIDIDTSDEISPWTDETECVVANW